MIDRRSVLKGGLALAAAGAAPVVFFSGPPARAGATGYSRAGFVELLDRAFYVGDDAHPTLELIEVAAGPSAPRVEQFTLCFRGAPGMQLPEGIHRLTPEGDAAVDLHLIPAGGDPSGSYFNAFFSLTIPSTQPILHGGPSC